MRWSIGTGVGKGMREIVFGRMMRRMLSSVMIGFTEAEIADSDMSLLTKSSRRDEMSGAADCKVSVRIRQRG